MLHEIALDFMQPTVLLASDRNAICSSWDSACMVPNADIDTHELQDHRQTLQP